MNLSAFIGLICALWLSTACHGFGYSDHGARDAFEHSFKASCYHFSFVHLFLDIMEREPNNDDRFVIYSFAEHGMGSNGGLGDRLAGLITASAFALRSGRRLLITGDAPFRASFAPYHRSNRKQRDVTLKEVRFDWHNWQWAGWQDAYYSNMTFVHGCVNPKARNLGCALDGDSSAKLSSFKVVKYRGNRCYLCRWAARPDPKLQDELLRSLGVRAGTDLYAVAGCLLRLVMWPTDGLWQQLDEWVSAQDASLSSRLTTPVENSGKRADVLPSMRQISVHFRCGDSSFATTGAGGSVNRQCVADPTGGVQWRGTSFGDDYSTDSPLDCAACARRVAQELQQMDGTTAVLLYVASDYGPSSSQINSTARWTPSLAPQESCHVDHTTSTGAHTCAVHTYVQWLLLSLSDVIVVQSLHKNADPKYAFYSEYSAATKRMEAELEALEPGGPVSAFSRYAYIYGLRDKGLRYGGNCTVANRLALSWQTRGNWMCDNKNFY